MMASLWDYINGNVQVDKNSPATSKAAFAYTAAPRFLANGAKSVYDSFKRGISPPQIGEDPYLRQQQNVEDAFNVAGGVMTSSIPFAPKGAGTLGTVKLPKNLQQATQQGYRVDEPLYHGSNQNIGEGFNDLNRARPDGTRTGAKNSVSFTTDPEFASEYALYGGAGPMIQRRKMLPPNENAQVYPAVTRGELWDPNNAEHVAKAFQYAENKYGAKRGWDDDEVLDQLKNADWRTVEQYLGSSFFNKNKFTGARMNEGGVENVLMFDSSAIRSPWAKFDPKKLKSTDLLASGLLGDLLLNKDKLEEDDG
jgi:hypothetical protein